MIDNGKAAAARIKAALGVRVKEVSLVTLDYGRLIGVAIEMAADGKRRAVRVEYHPEWERDAIDALLEWMEAHDAKAS